MTAPADHPTDLELMLYADGELEGERLAAVEAWLCTDRGARSKLAALDLASSVVREQAASLEGRGDKGDVADAVMARILATAPAATGTAPTRAARPAEPEKARAPEAPARPANDNARAFYAIAAAVMAVAAAFLLWSSSAQRSGGRVARHGGSRHADTHHPVSVTEVATAEPDALRVESDADPVVEHAPEHGVEVSALDLGSASGAVFYVPNGNPSAGTTTLVWLTDDEQDAAGDPQ